MWAGRNLGAALLVASLALACVGGGEHDASSPTSGAQLDDGGARDGGHDDDAPPRDAGQTSARDAGAVVDGEADAGPSDLPDADAGAGPPLSIGELCFGEIYDPAANGPDYDQHAPAVGSHCFGTDHQDIAGVERVVFVGDSVTVGTPPTASDDFYRARLADELAARFALDPPSALWKSANPLTGQASLSASGDFASCAKWGARTDDLLEDNAQLEECFPESERAKTSLVIFTIGGNDIAALTKDFAHAPYEEALAMTTEFVARLREAVSWLKDPARFPNGSHVVFANMFEFTDATGDVDSCTAASTAGFDEPWDRPEDLEALVILANEEFMRVAVDTGSDMIFLLEHFCGHGFHNDDPSGRCYRGEGAERWFDMTCIHPNSAGHDVIADMFLAVVDE